MIYLIGGAPRVGKTSLAYLLLDRAKIPFITTDQLITMLKGAAPQLGLDNNADPHEKSINFHPYLEHFVRATHQNFKNYAIEGDALLPEYVSKLKAKFHTQVCYLGYSTVTPAQLKQNPGFNDWISRLSDDQLGKLASWIIEMSKFYQNECFKYRLHYVDMAGSFDDNLEKAYTRLISEI